MIEIRFTQPTLERTGVWDAFDLLLGVVAVLEIAVCGRLLYREESFPIVELRAQLMRWLDGSLGKRQDFEFQSMEHDEPGLVWLRWVPEGGWRIGSIHQEYAETRAFTDDLIDQAVRRFTDAVDNWLRRELHVHIDDFLSFG
jgi:hypothetical protein